MLTRLYNYLFSGSADKSVEEIFRPHPSWAVINRQNRENIDRLYPSQPERLVPFHRLSMIEPVAQSFHESPPRLRLEPDDHDEDSLGVMPMDIDEDEPLGWYSEEALQGEEEGSSDDEDHVSEASIDEELPNRLLDPVHLGPMESPIATKNGHTYDRITLIELFKHHPHAETVPCPVTREPIELEAQTYKSNIALKQEIAARREEIGARRRAAKCAHRETGRTVHRVREREEGPEQREMRAKRLKFFEQPAQQMVTQTPIYGNIFTP